MTVARPDTLFSLIPAYRAAMFNRASAFNQFRTLFAPRKPRHPLVRVAVGLLGLAILAAMVFIGVFVGAAMILVGLAWKLLASRKPGAASGGPDRGRGRVPRGAQAGVAGLALIQAFRAR